MVNSKNVLYVLMSDPFSAIGWQGRGEGRGVFLFLSKTYRDCQKEALEMYYTLFVYFVHSDCHLAGVALHYLCQVL